MKEEPTVALTPAQLARLLALGKRVSDDALPEAGETGAGELLEDLVSKTLPLDPAEPRSLPAVLRGPCDELLPYAARTLTDLLADTETPLAAIKTFKEYGKALSRRAPSGAEHAVGTAIYYAAIASALVFHGLRITQHSYEKLEDGFAALMSEPWVMPDLKTLYGAARARCQLANAAARSMDGRRPAWPT